MNTKSLRSIRSYVRREGRMTPGQQKALQRWWSRYGIDVNDKVLDFNLVFGRSSEVVLDIGFGDGEALMTSAKLHPETNYLGIEVYRPGIGSVLHQLHHAGLDNVRLIIGDAKDILLHNIADATLSKIHVFFPDPWPKKRHHKRRLIQPNFAELLQRRLLIGGYLYVATDWTNYAEYIVSVLSQTSGLINQAGTEKYIDRPTWRPLTKFERRGQRRGHVVYDLFFRKES